MGEDESRKDKLDVGDVVSYDTMISRYTWNNKDFSALKSLKDAFLLLQGYSSDLTISIVRPGRCKSYFELVNFLYLFNCSVMNSS